MKKEGNLELAQILYPVIKGNECLGLLKHILIVQVRNNKSVQWQAIMDEILIPKLDSKKVTPSQIVKVLQILSILAISNDYEEIQSYFEETQVLDLVRELRSKEFI